MKKIIDGEELEIPTHVAIIMDGNGRWAKKRLLPRNMGHRQGAKVLEQICRDAADLGIRYLTVYAFSTENWKRSTEEVTGIMNLLRSYLSNCVERASKDGLRIRVIGDRSALDADIVEMLEHAERETAKFDKLDFTIALNYGGRDELRRTMTKLAKQVQEGTLARSNHRGCDSKASGYGRSSRSGSADPYKRRTAVIELSDLAACLCRILFHRYLVAGF